MISRARFKKFYDQFISLKGEPKNIAFGVAIGVFIGITPTIPFHTLLIIVFTFLLKKNFTAAYLGSWLVSNPVTIPILYVAEYHAGRCLLCNNWPEINFTDCSMWNIIDVGYTVAWPLLLGGIVVAPLFAIPAYFLTHRAIIATRKED
jgi:hypothetical protein